MKINVGTKDEMEIEGYTPDRNRKIGTIILCILTGGLLLLFLSWKTSIRVKFTHVPCPAGEATVILVTDMYNQVWREDVHRKTRVSFAEGTVEEIFFCNKNVKYVWDQEGSVYSRISYPPRGTLASDLHQEEDFGLTDEVANTRKEIYGENTIHIKTPSVLNLFISQAFNPFYIFQGYTIIVWVAQTYYIFSACIFFLSAISLFLNIWETRRQARVLREKVYTECKVRVLRSGYVKVIDSKDLVPGDVVIVVAGKELLEADMVLLNGSAVVNEAILTGETVPLTKIHLSPAENHLFVLEKQTRHILHCGTQVLQVRGGHELKALVTQTGYNTVKGDMVRSILFPKPLDFQIYSDFLRLIFIFILLGIVAMIWSLVNWSRMENVRTSTIIFNSIDLLTFVVPPIIPATITAINLWAQKRLQKEKMFCLSSNYINLAGPVDIVCFDKTGTLTEDDLSLEGVLPCEEAEFLAPVKDLRSLPISSSFTHAMATCHSVVRESDGSFIGHPLDIKMFSALGWQMFNVEPSEDDDIKPLFVVSKETIATGSELQVYKMFPFESGEQRMTVIAKEISSDSYEVFVKGAPERIESLCSEYSVPVTFKDVLEWYTKQGLRIVAAAYKTLPSSLSWHEICNMERETLEQGSIFLGLIIMQNRLKPETSPSLQVIHAAAISTVMVTGDNLLTASSVARLCGLVRPKQQIIFVQAELVPSSGNTAQHLNIQFVDSDQTSEMFAKPTFKSVVNPNYVFGIDGESFGLILQYEKETLKKIVHRGKIFARMKPEQKIHVVETLQQLGHQVAMCGDGCNDCGALKAAHVGISLSSTEASVAAPFTSLSGSVACVSTLIREGRASLISTYSSFKYNIAYSFSALIVVLFLFSIFTEPTDLQYLIMDLVLITVPSLMMGNTGASSILCKQRPTRRIVHPLHITSIISFLAFQTFLFWITWQYLERQSWFEPFIAEEDTMHPLPTYESTVILLQSFFSFIAGAVVFSHDFPFRKPIYTNKILSVYIILSTILCIIFLFCQVDEFYSFLTFKSFPYTGFSWTVFLSILLMSAICFIWERWFLYGIVEAKFLPWMSRLWGPSLPFEHLEKSMSSNSKWPRLSDGNRRPSESAFTIDPEEKQDSMESSQWKSHGFYRNSTKKHKFNAKVNYIDELEPLPINGGNNEKFGAFKARDSRTDRTEATCEESEMLMARNQNTSIELTTLNKRKGENSHGHGFEHTSNDQRENNYQNTFINEEEEKMGSTMANSSSNVVAASTTPLPTPTSPLPPPSPPTPSPPPPPPPSPPHFYAARKLADTEAHENGSMINLIRDMNTEWAKIRNSLHESMKELSLEVKSKEDSSEPNLSQDDNENSTV